MGNLPQRGNYGAQDILSSPSAEYIINETP